MEQHIGWKIGEKHDDKGYIELVIYNINKVSLFMTDNEGVTVSNTMSRELATKVIKNLAELLGLDVGRFGLMA